MWRVPEEVLVDPANLVKGKLWQTLDTPEQKNSLKKRELMEELLKTEGTEDSKVCCIETFLPWERYGRCSKMEQLGALERLDDNIKENLTPINQSEWKLCGSKKYKKQIKKFVKTDTVSMRTLKVNNKY